MTPGERSASRGPALNIGEEAILCWASKVLFCSKQPFPPGRKLGAPRKLLRELRELPGRQTVMVVRSGCTFCRIEQSLYE